MTTSLLAPAVPRLAVQDRAAIERRLRLSVAARNFGAAPVLNCLEEVARAGFDAVDNFNWRDPQEFSIYRDNLPRLGLKAGVLVVNKVPDVDAIGCSLTSPGDREGFLRELNLCIEAAHAVDCSRLEVLSGNVVPGESRATLMKTAADTLRAAVPVLEENGMTAVVEMLNSSVDHPGYFLDRVEDGVDLIYRVGSPYVKLLFDIYHVQVMQGNVISRIQRWIDCIGQFHFADVPGRHEPGTGEINYRSVFKAIYDLGDRYTGYATAEYHPTDGSFKDLAFVKELATFA